MKVIFPRAPIESELDIHQLRYFYQGKHPNQCNCVCCMKHSQVLLQGYGSSRASRRHTSCSLLALYLRGIDIGIQVLPPLSGRCCLIPYDAPSRRQTIISRVHLSSFCSFRVFVTKQGVYFLLRWPPARSSSSSSCYCKSPVHSPRRAITTGHTTPHLLTPGPRARIKSCVAYLSDILETEPAGCANEIRDCAQVLQNSSSA